MYSHSPKPFSRVVIRELWFSAIDVQSRHFDWSEHPHAEYGDADGDYGDYHETWNFIEVTRCENCHKLTTGTECEHCETDTYSEGPMMNYFWPLPGGDFDDANAKRLVDVPLCLVEIGDETGFALTGGGMDLSWEIAEAYIRCGYLPPASIDLPAMGGRGISRRDRRIIAAQRASYRAMAQRSRADLQRLDRMVAWSREHDDRRRVAS